MRKQMALQPHSPEPEQTGILAFIKLCGREKKKKKSPRVRYSAQGEPGSDLKRRSWGWVGSGDLLYRETTLRCRSG